MDFSFVLLATALAPFFASRLFTTAFALSIVGRLYENGHLDGVRELNILSSFQIELELALQPWFTSTGVIVALGVCAAIEILLEKNPDFAQLFTPVSPYFRSAGKFLLESTAVKATVAVTAAVATTRAGWADHLAVSALTAGLTFLLGWMRSAALGFLIDMDEEDDLGLRRLTGWAEDGWILFGVSMWFIAPILALLAAAAAALVMVGARFWLKRLDEKAKEPCPHCDAKNYRSAPACRQCGKDLPTPAKVGLFGQPKREPAADRDRHKLALLAKKRCAVCATRLPRKTIRQDCAACGSQMFPSDEWAARHLAETAGRLGRTLGVVALFGLIPVFGIIPAVIYYRIGLIAGLRGYVPIGAGCLIRWLARLVKLLLLLAQPVPLLGAVVLPLRCWIDYSLYRAAFQRERRKRFPSSGLAQSR